MCVANNGAQQCQSRWNGDHKARTCNVVPGPNNTFHEYKGTDGYQFECVEFVRRFYRLAKGCDSNASCNTLAWAGQGNASDYYHLASQFGLEAHANNTDFVMPEVDDILVYSGGEPCTYYPHSSVVATYCGHVNIIKSIVPVTATTWLVYVVEQNVDPSTSEQPLLLAENTDNTYSLIDPRFASVSQGLKNEGWTTLSIHGWLRLPPVYTGHYTVTDLGWSGSGPDGGAFPAVINATGQVAGSGNYFTYGSAHAYVYSGGVTKDIGSLGGYPIYPYGINNSGQVVGSAATASGAGHAFLYSGGAMTDLGTLPGDISSYAAGINDGGQVVGVSTAASGSNRAFIYSASTGMTDLSAAIGGSGNYSLGINDIGQVVGQFSAPNGVQHAFLYTNGTVTDLGALIGGGGVNSEARRITNNGQILISSDAGPYLYSAGTLTPIGFLPGYTRSLAEGVNNAGQVVGEFGCCVGFLYSGGTLTNLNSLGLGVYVGVAWDINDRGQIVVWGGEEYLLTPAP
jgi:probable HAF family extracellular repeat protein